MNHCTFTRRTVTLLAVVSVAALVHAQNRPPEPKGFGGRGGEQKGKQYAAPAGDGKNPAPSQVSITVEGGFRVIKANGLPDHAPGQFPNRGNPNVVAAQSYSYRVPAQPKENAQFTRLAMHPFGVALNGVVFDPGAAEWWQMDPRSGWTLDPISGSQKLGIDRHNAHVQPTGAYHYHGMPTGLVEKLSGGKEKVVQMGWAADGFPIYGPWDYSDAKSTNSAVKRMKSSYQLRPGTRASGPGGKFDGSYVEDFQFVKGAGDLDEANGRFGVTPEFPQGTYHYVLTDDFPFIPRQFKGTPDSSFFRHGPGPMRFGAGDVNFKGGPGGKGPPGKGRPF
ncbi:MAG: YHYH protein [Limisphaerales bacterium]